MNRNNPINPMPIEIEAKFYPVNKDDIRKMLKINGFELKYPERKMRRTIFDYKVNPQLKAHYIRVRDEGNGEIRLSAKLYGKKDSDSPYAKELEVLVNNFETTVAIFDMAGLGRTAYQETLRETWIIHDGVGETEIEIDTWPKLEPLVEVETYRESKLKETADLLELDWESRRTTSIVEVYMDILNWTYEETMEFLKDARVS